MWAVLDRALCKRAAGRYANAAEFAAALLDAIGPLSARYARGLAASLPNRTHPRVDVVAANARPPAQAPALVVPPVEIEPRRPWMRLGVVAALVVLVGGLGFLIRAASAGSTREGARSAASSPTPPLSPKREEAPRAEPPSAVLGAVEAVAPAPQPVAMPTAIRATQRPNPAPAAVEPKRSVLPPPAASPLPAEAPPSVPPPAKGVVHDPGF